MLPTKLEFDATQAPESCNDKVTFREILTHWVLPTVLTDSADRRLIVRIVEDPSGKRADATLVDAVGTILAEDHKRFPTATECHKVLWVAAYSAATLMGAFAPPPLHSPPPPAPPPPEPPPPPPARCPRCPVVKPISLTHPVTLGMGAFYATALLPEPVFGPRASLTYTPMLPFPALRLEFDAAWTSQPISNSNKTPPTTLFAIPIVGSFCYAPQVLRLCGGMATSFFFTERASKTTSLDELRITLATSWRVGTEIPIHGPLSIRADLFALVQFEHRSSGRIVHSLDALDPVIAGATMMGTWSLN